MTKRSEPPLIEPLSDSEFGELDDLLLSDDLPEESMDAITLEGFLTAIAIGPVTVSAEQWLLQVFASDRRITWRVNNCGPQEVSLDFNIQPKQRDGSIRLPPHPC